MHDHRGTEGMSFLYRKEDLFGVYEEHHIHE